MGSDHHGYIGRLRAGLASLSFSPEDLEVVLVQFISLYRGKKKIQMSTRSGEFTPMSELYNEVGVDAARFFYVSKSQSQHLDFDLELAKQTNNENPVYYIQYAHARINSIFRKASISKKNFDSIEISLINDHEESLSRAIIGFSESLDEAIGNYAPHRLAVYLHKLAQEFGSFYENCPVLLNDDELTMNRRLALCNLTARTLSTGLNLLGIDALERM